MKNLFQLAKRCLQLPDPQEKIALGQEIAAAWQAGQLAWREHPGAIVINQPGRPSRPTIVPPAKLAKRGFGSDKQLGAFFHALAHIELTAVNLSWDSICRYPDMPKAYYQDWIQTALEEGEHFSGLQQQMLILGYQYGDFPAHGELWDMAVKTGHNLMHRMAIVHRVLEARALDVVPFAVNKLAAIGKTDASRLLTRIANDEVGHVSAGTRWYRFLCERQQLDPDQTFFVLIQQYLSSWPRGPFNLSARKQSGFSENELAILQENDYLPRKNKR